MKIGEATQTYSDRINELWERKRALLKQQNELSNDPDKKEELDSVTLELQDVDSKYDVVADFMEKLIATKTGLHNAEVAKQQGDAWAEATEDASKCMEIARRIAEGGKVPAKDAEKLMKFNPQMYMQALNAAAMNKNKSNKEYDSLWEDEDSPTENTDIDADIDNMELSIDPPDIE